MRTRHQFPTLRLAWLCFILMLFRVRPVKLKGEQWGDGLENSSVTLSNLAVENLFVFHIRSYWDTLKANSSNNHPRWVYTTKTEAHRNCPYTWTFGYLNSKKTWWKLGFILSPYRGILLSIYPKFRFVSVYYFKYIEHEHVNLNMVNWQMRLCILFFNIKRQLKFRF